MPAPWEIFLVDDEPDIHEVTRLALKHRKWRKRKFNLTSASSGTEAREIIDKRAAAGEPPFHVALVDVVMETNEAGLDLCRHIRNTCPRSFRIILRTGQPGVAPEEFVLNEYDIDYYLAKVEATPERLYAVMRACLRSSEDIATLMAYGSQLQNFTRALRSVSALSDLMVFMREGLRFLELKHNLACLFLSDLTRINDPDTTITNDEIQFQQKLIRNAAYRCLDKQKDDLAIFVGEKVGMPENTFLIPFHVEEHRNEDDEEEEEQAAAPVPGDDDEAPVAQVHDAKQPSKAGADGALFAYFLRDAPTEKEYNNYFSDARLFISNWRIAFSTLQLQERLARETMLREKMYYERMQSVASMVAGVAHEMNTPIGVANTANSMLTDIVNALVKNPSDDPEERAEMADDLISTSELLGKNLHRAKELVSSFKQLSSSQLSDHKVEVDLYTILKDCVTTMGPECRKKQLKLELDGPEGEFIWDGYPSYLTQVIVNFIQNALRYAYPEGEGGKVDIRLKQTTFKKGPGFRIEFEDYGLGVKPEILPRLFEPFVTSARGKGGTGLGLSITHNICTNMLKGRVDCHSEVGKGTKFTVDVPQTVPVVEDPALEEMRRLKGVAGD